MRKKSIITTIRGHSFYTGLVNSESVIFDLGAHKGEFSSEISNGFGCKCHLVEALPSLFSQIDERPFVKKYNFAMAGRDEPVELFVSKNLEGSTITGSSASGSEDAVTVDGVTLGTLMARAGIETIDLLKIDIEGAEVGLFEAASNDLLSNITQITVEFHDFVPGVISTHQAEEIKERLQGLGFYAIKFSRSLNTDVLFINRKLSRMSRAEYWYIKYIVKYTRGIARIFQKLIAAKH
ncbi:MAG: FkbM family methyltransferase [Ignavibacteriaceae bacterium]